MQGPQQYSEEERKKLVAPEVAKLDAIEIEVEAALHAGNLNGIGLSAAQMVDLMKERRRLIEDRCRLLNLFPILEVPER